jgi:hypothetical protein
LSRNRRRQSCTVGLSCDRNNSVLELFDEVAIVECKDSIVSSDHAHGRRIVRHNRDRG